MINNTQQWWGEIENPKKHDYSVFIEKAKTYSCSKDHNMKIIKEDIYIPPMEPRLLHTIALHQHANEVLDLIQAQELSNEVGAALMLESPPIPEEENLQLRCVPQAPFEFLPKQSDDFTKGISSEPPVINSEIRLHLLKQSVAVLLAHIGYETSTLSALEVLKDVLDEFLSRICCLLRTSFDTSVLGYSEGFPDEIERILKEIGVGGMRSLHDYYSQRVINYQKIMKNRCEQLVKKHGSLKPKIKYEMHMHEDEVPEIHLGAIEGDQSNLTSLESGFQMLDSLEQEVHLHIMEDQENKMN